MTNLTGLGRGPAVHCTHMHTCMHIYMHPGALAAALPCTVSSTRARLLLGYAAHKGAYVTRDAAIASCKQPRKPLLDAPRVAAAIDAACARG